MRTILALSMFGLLLLTGCQYVDTNAVNSYTDEYAAHLSDGRYDEAAAMVSNSFTFTTYKGRSYNGTEMFYRVARPLIERRGADLFREQTSQVANEAYAVVATFMIGSREWKLKFTWAEEGGNWKLINVREVEPRPPVHSRKISAFTPSTKKEQVDTSDDGSGGGDARLSTKAHVADKIHMIEE